MYDKIRPGKIWYDASGKRIQAHGGSIIYAEEKFWWYGENKEGVTGTATGERCPFWHHGVKLYSSADLYNWRDEGFAVKESEDKSNPFHPSNIMDRPHIIYNKKTGNYVLWAKTSRTDFGACGFSICVGKSLKNMIFIKEIIPEPFRAGDFDLFEENGKAYVVFENPHDCMVLYELDEDYTGLSDKYSAHLHSECPPFVREAPAVFKRGGKIYMLSSGTTGYFPNPSALHEITDLHGEWKDLGNPCVGDKNENSFRSQFSSVFRHPLKEDVYIALGDRWLTDLVEDMPDIREVFYGIFSDKAKKKYTGEDLRSLSDENTSEANYVWLPVVFDADTPRIRFLREWKI
ncbi:MAG: family 43 glycosylhydrolase [Clostridia bacterium]|nr:family 43 glycosylhydrolase [Clostridia bacterium]